MAAGDYIIPGAQAVTEWFSRFGGFINGCGQASLAVINGIMTGSPPSVAEVTSLIQQGAASGATGPTGVSTLAGLQQLGASTGTPLTIGSGATTISTINSNLTSGLPTLVGVSNAHVFGGSDRNVSGHYITVVGKAANGNFIVADPNQPQATSGGFVQYTAQQIMNAQPFGTGTPQGTPGGIAGATAAAISGGITTGFQNVLNGLFGSVKSNLGISSLSDFAWRSALIVGGMVLIVIGLLVFFSKQEGQAVTVVSQQAGTAAKVAAAAA